MDIINDKQAMQRLREAAERAKIELSTVLSSEINLPFIGAGKDGKPAHFTYSLTRAKLEDIVLPIVEKTTKPVMPGAEGREAGAEGHRQGHTDRRAPRGCR